MQQWRLQVHWSAGGDPGWSVSIYFHFFTGHALLSLLSLAIQHLPCSMIFGLWPLIFPVWTLNFFPLVSFIIHTLPDAHNSRTFPDLPLKEYQLWLNEFTVFSIVILYLDFIFVLKMYFWSTGERAFYCIRIAKCWMCVFASGESKLPVNKCFSFVIPLRLCTLSVFFNYLSSYFPEKYWKIKY